MAITKEQAQLVIQGMYEGQSVGKQLKSQSIPARSFYEAVSKDLELARDYRLAQVARGELLVDEVVEIADSFDDPARSAVRVNTRKWYASKMCPDKYGDRLDVNMHHTVDVAGALEAARARTVRPPCDLPTDAKTQLLEIPAQQGILERGSEPVAPSRSFREDDDIFS